jgi:cytochrome c556
MNTDMLAEITEAGPDIAGEKEYDIAIKTNTQENTMQRATALCLFLGSSASDGITGKLISAVWDPWEKFSEKKAYLENPDVYTLRRVVPDEE